MKQTPKKIEVGSVLWKINDAVVLDFGNNTEFGRVIAVTHDNEPVICHGRFEIVSRGSELRYMKKVGLYVRGWFGWKFKPTFGESK